MNKFHVIVGSLIYALVLVVAVTNFTWPMILLVAFAPLLVMTLSSKSFFLLIPIATLHSGLFIPGLPGNFQLYQAMAMLCVGLRIVDVAFTKAFSREARRFDSLCALFLVAWIIMLMTVRGTGMRVLGSSQYGGATYIQALASLMFYVLSAEAVVSPRHLRRAGIWMGLLGILPLIANGFFELSGGVIWRQLMFFRLGAAAIGGALDIRAGEDTRFSFMASGAAFLWVGVFASARAGGFGNAKYIWWPLAAVCAVMSGFRSTVLGTFAFFVAYGFMKTKSKPRFILICIVLGALMYVGILLWANKLPFAAQRVLSNIPGVEVEWRAKIHAATTMIWRQEVWSLAMQDLSRYWLVGRGITFSPDAMPVLGWMDSAQVAYLTGGFHQATLELMILYGVPALIACLGFYLYVLSRGYVAQFTRKAAWNDPMLKDWGLCLLLYVLVRSMLAFAGGISQELLVTLPLYLALYNIIRNTDREQKETHENGRRSHQLEQRAGHPRLHFFPR